MSKEVSLNYNKMTPEQIELITRTVAKGATQDELKLFIFRCELLKLNPLKPGQVHFIKYGNSPGVVVVGIEGFRSTAARTGRHVRTERGIIKSEDGTIAYGWATVVKLDPNGKEQEFKESSPFNEYNNDKNPSWRKMPETMIKKVAEAAALRMAYPDDLGGIFIPEEQDVMEATAIQSNGIHPEQPDADEGDPNAVHEYTPGFGQWSKYTLKEICSLNPRETIEKYLETLDKYMICGKYPENHDKFKDFIERMTNFLTDQENK